jgi:hypothetical protein
MNENNQRNDPNANLNNPPINDERCNDLNYFSYLLEIILFWLITIGILIISSFRIFFYNSSCDLTNPINRDFEKYYGIKENYFQEVNGEKSGIPVYTAIIPNQIFKSSSFVCVAPVGSGKSLLRKHYVSKRLSPIQILNNEIDYILNNFVSNLKKIHKDTSDLEIIRKFWTNEDFEHTVFYYFSQNLLEGYANNKSLYKKFLHQITNSDDKYQLFLMIMIFASSEKRKTLDEFVKDLWDNFSPEDHDNLAEVIREKKKKERDDKLNKSIKLIEAFFKDIRILDSLNNNLSYLYAKIEEMGLSPTFQLKFDKLSIYTEFYKTILKITPTIVIDSLDESNYFLKEKSDYKSSIKTFISSAFYQTILSKVYDQSIEIIYFFIKYDEINVQDMVFKKDKIPIVELDWNRNQLKNYGDFVLKTMELEQRNECEKLPNFYNLVDYRRNYSIINQLKTPRQINIFMQELTLIMNYGSENYNFRVTSQNVEEAFDKAKKKFFSILS